MAVRMLPMQNKAGGLLLLVRLYRQTHLLLSLSLTSVFVMSWTYTYSRETMSWTDAKAWCENRSSWLMVIPNKTHNDYLKDNLPQQHKMYYWIGLRKTQGNWTWQGTAQRLEDGGSWADKEPNNKRQDEDCVEIYINNGTQNGKWNDENCNKKKHALCYDASCSEKSCSRNAECVEEINNYTCKCNPGFTGRMCMDVIRCNALGSVHRGSMHCTDFLEKFAYGSVCQFECDVGFFLMGSYHTHFSSEGKWSHNPPVCQVFVQCPPIATVLTNGRINCSHPLNSDRYNSKCVFMCEEGFELRGSDTTLCDHTGQWTHVTPNCTGMLCKALTVPDGGIVNCYRGNSTICTVQCPSAYLLIGAHEYTCRPDGSWSQFQPLCASYKHMLMASAGCAVLSTICCCMFCCSYCRKRKKSVKQNDQEEVMMPVYDADNAPLEEPLSSL
ncbi:L-selectin isoform X1 [Tachysurus ichikawai]